MSYETAHSYWLTSPKLSHFPGSPSSLTTGKCWWCGSPADTREHRVKRTDIVREFGSRSSKDNLLVSRLRVSAPQRGPNGDVWKFKKCLCAKCNNVRSQPFDEAQTKFASYLSARETTIAKTRRIRFSDVFSTQSAAPENLRKYFVKHVACRMQELDRPVSQNVVAYMNATEPLRDIAFSFGFVPRFYNIIRSLPRNESGSVGDEDIDRFVDATTRQTCEIASGWSYRAFVLQWVYRWNSTEEPLNPFSWDEVALEECEMKMPAFIAPAN